MLDYYWGGMTGGILVGMGVVTRSQRASFQVRGVQLSLVKMVIGAKRHNITRHTNLRQLFQLPLQSESRAVIRFEVM